MTPALFRTLSESLTHSNGLESRERFPRRLSRRVIAHAAAAAAMPLESRDQRRRPLPILHCALVFAESSTSTLAARGAILASRRRRSAARVSSPSFAIHDSASCACSLQHLQGYSKRWALNQRRSLQTRGSPFRGTLYAVRTCARDRPTTTRTQQTVFYK